MNIVLLETDSLGAGVDLSGFHALGNVTSYPLSTAEETIDRAADADVIIVNKIPMNAQTLAKASHLKAICLTATGMNNIDFDYTNSRGIQVRNVKGYSTASVIQHTFAMLFYLYEHLPEYDTYVKSGEYCNSPTFCHLEPQFHELSGKTFGIIGLGEIGRGVAKIAAAFGCRVIYYSTTGANSNPDYERVDLDTLLSESDIISIHAPLTVQTQHLINTETLSKMKKTAFLLNLGRGPIIDETALCDALLSGRIAGAGLDVLEIEPMQKNCVLRDPRLKNKLLITPHIGWAPLEARQRCINETLKNIQGLSLD